MEAINEEDTTSEDEDDGNFDKDIVTVKADKFSNSSLSILCEKDLLIQELREHGWDIFVDGKKIKINVMDPTVVDFHDIIKYVSVYSTKKLANCFKDRLTNESQLPNRMTIVLEFFV